MHTNETVNYKLSQFVGTDIPNPLVDYNGDMEKIDTAIKNVADAAVAEGDRVTALETQNGSETLDTTAQTLSGAVNELKGGVDGLDTRMTTAEGKIITDESTLATAVSNISTLAGKVSAVETKVGSAVLVTTAQDLSGAVNELADEIEGTGTGLASRVTALETQAGNAVLVTTAQTLSGAINELAQGGSATVAAEDVTYNDVGSHLGANNVQDAIEALDEEGHAIAGELQTTELAVGATSATVNFTQTIGATTIITPVCSLYGVSPTAVTYTTNSITLTFEAQAEVATVGARIQTI